MKNGRLEDIKKEEYLRQW